MKVAVDCAIRADGKPWKGVFSCIPKTARTPLCDVPMTNSCGSCWAASQRAPRERIGAVPPHACPSATSATRVPAGGRRSQAGPPAIKGTRSTLVPKRYTPPLWPWSIAPCNALRVCLRPSRHCARERNSPHSSSPWRRKNSGKARSIIADALCEKHAMKQQHQPCRSCAEALALLRALDFAI